MDDKKICDKTNKAAYVKSVAGMAVGTANVVTGHPVKVVTGITTIEASAYQITENPCTPSMRGGYDHDELTSLGVNSINGMGALYSSDVSCELI